MLIPVRGVFSDESTITNNYIMAYEYSNIILFYCFANKLIVVTKNINDVMSNDIPYHTIPLSIAFLIILGI